MQIPFFQDLHRSVLNTMHLSMTKKRYERGAVVCKEGEDSMHIYIVNKGEFQVSKVVDMCKVDQVPKTKSKTNR